jgi:hypothetical protein
MVHPVIYRSSMHSFAAAGWQPQDLQLTCCSVDPAGFKTESTVLVAGGTGRVFARGLDTQQLEVQASG